MRSIWLEKNRGRKRADCCIVNMTQCDATGEAIHPKCHKKLFLTLPDLKTGSLSYAKHEF